MPLQDSADVAIIGAGAAGLTAGIFAVRTNAGRRVVLLDGAAKPGAKILVSGGGRCNVTHDVVDETAYAGSSRNAVRKVLLRFGVDQTIAWFRELGVELKREDTGKLFPTTDSARTVLDALLHALRYGGAELWPSHRVDAVSHRADAFVVSGTWGQLRARCIILATGGKALPKSGSDGHGYALAQALGHTVTPRIVPALVPLTLEDGSFLRELGGISTEAALTVHAGSGKALVRMRGSLLCTHFGLSGPVVLDISRYYIHARLVDAEASLRVNWLPDFNTETFESYVLSHPKASIYQMLHSHLPERLARALLDAASVAVGETFGVLTRERRQQLSRTLTALHLPIAGDRGFTYAEVTAGGVPLRELHLQTMESRVCPKLFLCGEICDVDGRIGGYNFQWAWASGYVAGLSV